MNIGFLREELKRRKQVMAEAPARISR